MNFISQNNFKICHSIPGRLRIKVPSIRYSSIRSHSLEHILSKHVEIKAAKVRPLTGSVIIVYDKREADSNAVINLLRICLQVESKKIFPPEPEDKSKRESQICYQTTPTHSLKGKLIRVLALGSILVYGFIRKLIFKSPLSQSPLSLLTLVATWAMIPLLRHAWQEMRQRKNMNLFPFMFITYSALTILMGKAFVTLEIIWTLEVSLLLEYFVVNRLRNALRKLLGITTKKIVVLVDGKEIEIEPENVRKGDAVVACATEIIPVDGVVLEGEALVDEKRIIGCFKPQIRKKDDKVFAGTIVLQGQIFILADKVGGETYLCRILYMMEDALERRSPAEEKTETITSLLMNLGNIAVVVTFLVTGDLLQALTVMVVMSCTCVTVLAASTAVMAALASAARNYILVKGGVSLELIGQADCFCFSETILEYPYLKDTLDALRKDGVSCQYIVTSNSHQVDKSVLKKLGFNDYIPALSSQEKALYIDRLKGGDKNIVMVGDAVNDASALSRASVGIAMAAGGIEATAETADIIVADGDLRRIVFLRHLSHQTLQIINENYWMTVFTDIIGLILETRGLLSPLLGGILHMVHTFGVMLNSNRLIGQDTCQVIEYKSNNQMIKKEMLR